MHIAVTDYEYHQPGKIIGAEFVILPGMRKLYDVKIKTLPFDYLWQGCQTYGPCKDFVPQCERLVSEVGLRNLRENVCKVMADNLQKLRQAWRVAVREAMTFFFGDQHFELHPITSGDRLIKVWGPLIYTLACLCCFSTDSSLYLTSICWV